jgi:hypothetical protein
MGKTLKPNEGFLPSAEAPEAPEATQFEQYIHLEPEALEAPEEPKNTAKKARKAVNFDELKFERATENEFDEFFTFENDGDQITGVVLGVAQTPKVEGYLIDTLDGGIVCVPCYSALQKVVENFDGALSETVFRFTRLNKSKIQGTTKDYISFRIEKAKLNG